MSCTVRKNRAVKASGRFLLWCFVPGSVSILTAAQGQGTSGNGSASPAPTEAPYDPDTYYVVPPWGLSSFGYVNRYGSNYRGAFGFGDIVRPGWSWTRPEMRTSMLFCYDTIPGRVSECYTGQVKDVCESHLGGVAVAGDQLCLTNQPYAVVGPTCWNNTCYGKETLKACEEASGYLIGTLHPDSESYDEAANREFWGQPVAWCVVPGDKHTVLGPACYGRECFKKELAQACESLGGTNFADLFCLLNESYTVIGPICVPTGGPIEDASVCYPEEAAAACADMNGTSVGDIFCVVEGDYSVLGPFCTTFSGQNKPERSSSYCASEAEGKKACSELSGRSVGNGTFCVLPGLDYRLLGPLCMPGGGCLVYNDENDPSTGNGCERDFRGTAVGEHSCIIQGEYTIIGPATYGGIRFDGDNVLGPDLSAESVVSLFYGDGPTVLNGTYSVFGPACYGASCYEADCEPKISGIFCALPRNGDGTGPAPPQKPFAWHALLSTNLPALTLSALAVYLLHNILRARALSLAPAAE
jgi:hypothetical protein